MYWDTLAAWSVSGQRTKNICPTFSSTDMADTSSWMIWSLFWGRGSDPVPEELKEEPDGEEDPAGSSEAEEFPSWEASGAGV